MRYIDQKIFPPVERVTDSLASLAASAVANGTTIDLGENFSACVVIGRKGITASAGEVLQLVESDDQVNWYAMATPASGAGLAYNSTSNGNMAVNGRPTRRFVRLNYTNGATQQSATSFLTTAVHYGV